MKKIIIILIIIMTVKVYANTSGVFLSMPVSAREAALGGAMAAVNNEIDAVTFNPAGLSKFNGFGIALMYNKMQFGNTYGKATIVHPAGFGMLGVSFSFLSVPFENTFISGETFSSKSINDISLAVAFQRDISENLSIGVGAKFISMDLGEVTASGAGADIGLLYQINPKAVSGRFNIGAGVRNIGSGLKFVKESESLPMTVVAGIMYQPIQLITIYGEMDKPRDMGTEYGGGLELSLFNILKPRVGYRSGNGVGMITGGMYIGAEMGSTTLGVDYAMGAGVEMNHIVELKIQRPAIFEFGRIDTIPYDGKNPTRIAVNDLAVKGCEEELGRIVAEWLRHDWAKSEVLTVLARENMVDILNEQELQMIGITSSRDAVTIGEILNVQYMIVGNLSKVGNEYYINVKVVNINSGKVEATAEEISGSKATLRLAARRLALKLDPSYNK